MRAAVADHAVTVLAAPLGAGKSCALTQALGGAAGFVRLDVESWQRGDLVPSLVASIRRVRDGFGRSTLGALASGVAPQLLGPTFIRDLLHVDTPLVIAIDNAHVVYDDPAFGSVLEAALAGLPHSVRLIVAGRALPDADLTEAFARGRLAILGNDVLRFTSAEIVMLAHRLEREFNASDLISLEALTDGWATAVGLALTTPLDAIPSLRSAVAAAAYLEMALLPLLTPDAVAFLESASVFEILDLTIIERSALFADARAQLSRLERSGALVSALAEAGRFRIHPILRELAAKRLAARGGATAAHTAAVAAYANANMMPAALYHVVAAEDPQLAATFLRAHAVAAIATGDRSQVRAAAGLIDAAGSDGYVAAFVRGLDEKAAGNHAARLSFGRAREGALRSGDASIAFYAGAQIVEHDLGRLRHVDAPELAALRVEAQPLGAVALATAEMLGGWNDAIRFDFRAAAERIGPLTHAGDGVARFNTGILLAYAQTALGNFATASDTLDALVRLLETDDRVVLETLALVWFARLALAWGTTSAAYDAATQAQRLAASLNLHAEEGALYVALTELATHRGDAGAAVRYAEMARERARSAWYVADVSRIRAFAEVAAARAAFLGHDNAIARSLALHAAELPDIAGPMRALALTEAACYTLLCEPGAAPAAIAMACDAAREARPVDIGDAVALVAADDLLTFLSAANGEPMSERYPVPGPFDAFVAERRNLITLEFAGIAVGNARRGRGSPEALAVAFEQVARHGPRFEGRLARAYASRFVRAVKVTPSAPAAFELTAREREILGLLVDGLTNKEIAQRIALSPRTVETHVERVLGKLEVGSRSRAIAKALRLGLVELEPERGDP